MRYLCVHCDHRFEAEGEEVPKRCPSCMRAKGIEPVRAAEVQAPRVADKKRQLLWLIPVAAALALALIPAGTGAFVYWTHQATNHSNQHQARPASSRYNTTLQKRTTAVTPCRATLRVPTKRPPADQTPFRWTNENTQVPQNVCSTRS